jgi:hypothetical protein
LPDIGWPLLGEPKAAQGYAALHGHFRLVKRQDALNFFSTVSLMEGSPAPGLALVSPGAVVKVYCNSEIKEMNDEIEENYKKELAAEKERQRIKFESEENQRLTEIEVKKSAIKQKLR